MGKHDSNHTAPVWRTKTVVSAVIMLIIIVLSWLGFRWLLSERPLESHSTVPITEYFDDEDEESTEEFSEDEPAEPSSNIIVHVAGEVQDPGIVELPPDSRVVDAIQKAGGASEQAQLDALNLAAIVTDGEYILVPDTSTVGSDPGTMPISPNQNATNSSQKINLNTATASELETLPGVGPATAANIIAHREQHGRFTELSDIEAISGIGPATRERLDGLVSW